MWPFKKKTVFDLFFKRISVHGVLFDIQKLDPIAFLDGSKAMIQTFDIYKLKTNEAEQQASLVKIKEHYRDVFMSAVVEPKLKRKQEDKDGLFVDHLFTDWDLANELYARIMEFTYGKKKIKRAI